MKLQEAVTEYVTYKQSLGMRFATEARTLKSFCRSQEGQELAKITAEAIETFIAGHGLRPDSACASMHPAGLEKRLRPVVPFLGNQAVPITGNPAEVQPMWRSIRKITREYGRSRIGRHI